MENLPSKTRRVIKYALVILGAVLVVLAATLAWNVFRLRHSQILRHGFRPPAIMRNHQALTISDLNIVQPWMTFDYLNHVFNLPADYLKTKLAVSDANYPRLSLSSFSASNHLNQDAILTEIKKAISDYLSAKK